MNYKDLENISYLSQQILTEAAFEEHDVMNRWPYASPYLQEARDGYGDDSKFRQDTDAASFRPGKDVPKVKTFGRISRAVPHGIGAHANRTASRVTTIVGDDPGAPRSQKIHRKNKLVKKNGKWHKVKEQLELWVNSLLDEGYDLSNYTWDDMYEIYLNEAEGSYGQTPKANLRYSNLARKGNKAAAKHAKRTDTRETPGERETRIRRTGMTQADRTYNRGAAEYGSTAYDPEEMDEPSGPGGMPKGKKLARQRKRGVSAESYDLYDLVLAHLIDEGYAETQEAANAIMANMSEDWIGDIVESFDLYEAEKPLPISKMSKQARRKAFNAASETHSDETGIGLVSRSDNTARQIRTMARVGGKKVKSHIKKGYEQGRNYDPYYQELNSRNPSRNKYD